MHHNLKLIRALHKVPSRQFSSGPYPHSKMPYMDSTDNFGGLLAAMPKDIGNIPNGGTFTYGFAEYVQFLNTVCVDWWMFCSYHSGGALIPGLVVATLSMRTLFGPIGFY